MFLDIRQLLRSWMSTWHVPELHGLQYNLCVPVIWMFLNTKLFLNVPRYQTTSAFLNVNMTCSWTSQTSIQSLCPRNLNVPEYKTVPECSWICDMLLNLKVIFKILNVPEFPVHQHNFHVPECLCDGRCFWKWKWLLLFFPEYQCFCIECKTVPECSMISDNFCVSEYKTVPECSMISDNFCVPEYKTVPECSWISEISVFLNVNVNMKVIFKIPSILEFYLISAQLLCSSVSENSVWPRCSWIYEQLPEYSSGSQFSIFKLIYYVLVFLLWCL